MAFSACLLVHYAFILRLRAISLREASRAATVVLEGETCENDGKGCLCICAILWLTFVIERDSVSAITMIA